MFTALAETIPYEIHAGVEVGGVNADIVINKVAIECDGIPNNTKERYTNVKKQAILERCGFRVLRVTKREWDLSQKSAIERIKTYV